MSGSGGRTPREFSHMSAPTRIADLGLDPADIELLEAVDVTTAFAVTPALIERLGDDLGALSQEGAKRLQAAAYGFPVKHQPHPSERGPKRHRHPPAVAAMS